MSVLANPQQRVAAWYPSLQKRRDRQHFDKHVLSLFTIIEGEEVFDIENGRKKIGTAKLVGECTRLHPMYELYYEAWCYEITLLDGTIVPATQLKGGNYVLSQDLQYKMRRCNSR